MGNEYLKLCLEGDVAFNALYEVSQLLARAEVPQEIVEGLRVSALTALLKPNRRVRSTSAGDTFRRLVPNAWLGRRKILRVNASGQTIVGYATAVAQTWLPTYFGTSQTRTPTRSSGVLMGAFDHICRARVFETLLGDHRVSSLIPFVKQRYARPSRYLWRDSSGAGHDILQGDGGEQGDALVPAFLCLALKPAFDAIQAALPDGAIVFCIPG